MKYNINQSGGPPVQNRLSKVFCYHCMGTIPTPPKESCSIIKKNLVRHTKRLHEGKSAAWLCEYIPLTNEEEENKILEF